MTAIAVALVLCCAMVCGTVLALKGVGSRDAADVVARREITALQRETQRQVGDASDIRRDVASLKADIDSLRAQVALRSM